MNKNHYLARHMMDPSWGMFEQMLRYNANRIVEVEPYNTSVEARDAAIVFQRHLQ